MPFRFPKLYPILDSSVLPAEGRASHLHELGSSLAGVGVPLLEYRNKTGTDEQILEDAEALRAAMPMGKVRLILDDRADLVQQVNFDGVHVDSGDLSPAEARALLGPDKIVGTYGGTEALLPGILDAPVDYLSIGPIYPTTTKSTTKSPIGLDGVRQLRIQAGPDAILVAVGGITLDTASEILAAGASVIAVSAAIFRAADPAAEARRWIKSLG